MPTAGTNISPATPCEASLLALLAALLTLLRTKLAELDALSITELAELIIEEAEAATSLASAESVMLAVEREESCEETSLLIEERRDDVSELTDERMEEISVGTEETTDAAAPAAWAWTVLAAIRSADIDAGIFMFAVCCRSVGTYDEWYQPEKALRGPDVFFCANEGVW
jgi:hypothetical protein